MECPNGHRIGKDWETEEDCGACPWRTWTECSDLHHEKPEYTQEKEPK